jgi:hypothetical protein
MNNKQTERQIDRPHLEWYWQLLWLHIEQTWLVLWKAMPGS